MIYMNDYLYNEYVRDKVSLSEHSRYDTNLEHLVGNHAWKFYYCRSENGKTIKLKPVYGQIVKCNYGYYEKSEFFPLKKDGSLFKKGSSIHGRFYADTEAEAIEEFNRICNLYIADYKKAIQETEDDLL